MKSPGDENNLSLKDEDNSVVQLPSVSFFQRILPFKTRISLNEEDLGQNEKTLKGKPLQVYWYLLTHGAAGVREIQKILHFSSPGVVSYQLNKLTELGIISKNEETDKYYIKEEIKSGILGFYIRFGYRMIPRFSIYLSLFICGLIIFFILSFMMGDAFITHPGSILLFFFLSIGIIAFVFESVKMWNIRPN